MAKTKNKGKNPSRAKVDIICPRCNETILKNPITHNAITQEDGKTFICTSCGINESRITWLKAKNLHNRIPKEEIELSKKFREKLGL